jgi:hypothetical protein
VNFTTKNKELEQAKFEQVRQYFNIANGQLMGGRIIAFGLMQRQRWKADISRLL